MSQARQARVIQRAISKLESLRDSGMGIVEVVAYGSAALPALKSLLCRREPSGLFDARCRAVDALAALKAYDVLIQYLSVEHARVDPVERLGDDAVINYAAWSLARTREERVFALLLRLAQRPSLSGVIGALGTFGRREAIPALVNALEEDVSRNVAEFMLRRQGPDALAALVASAQRSSPSPDRESESSRRRRRSSLMLLAAIGMAPGAWPQLRALIWDDDLKIAVLACKLWLSHGPAGERREAIDRLGALLPSMDWILRQEAENILAAAGPQARFSFTRKAVH